MLHAAAVVLTLSLLPTNPPTRLNVRAHRRSGCIFASEAETSESTPDSIFTLEERKDGWDDVRGSIKGAIKDRQGAVEALNEWNANYVKPAARWAKVLAEELPLPSVEMPSVDIPSKLTAAPSAPAPSVVEASTPAAPKPSLKNRLLGVTTAV